MDTIARQFAEILGFPHGGQIRFPLRGCPHGEHIDHLYGLVTVVALDVNVDLLYIPTLRVS